MRSHSASRSTCEPRASSATASRLSGRMSTRRTRRTVASSPSSTRTGWLAPTSSSRKVSSSRAGLSSPRRARYLISSSVAASAQCRSSTSQTVELADQRRPHRREQVDPVDRLARMGGHVDLERGRDVHQGAERRRRGGPVAAAAQHPARDGGHEVRGEAGLPGARLAADQHRRAEAAAGLVQARRTARAAPRSAPAARRPANRSR